MSNACLFPWCSCATIVGFALTVCWVLSVSLEGTWTPSQLARLHCLPSLFHKMYVPEKFRNLIFALCFKVLFLSKTNSFT